MPEKNAIVQEITEARTEVQIDLAVKKAEAIQKVEQQ